MNASQSISTECECVVVKLETKVPTAPIQLQEKGRSPEVAAVTPTRLYAAKTSQHLNCFQFNFNVVCHRIWTC